MLLGITVQEYDLALVPALIRLSDVGQVERGRAEGRVLRHSRNASLVALLDVFRVALIPDVYGQIRALCVSLLGWLCVMHRIKTFRSRIQ